MLSILRGLAACVTQVRKTPQKSTVVKGVSHAII